MRNAQRVFWLLIWVGLVLAIAALCARVITEVWGNLSMGLLITGLLFIALGLILRWRFGPPGQSRLSWWRRRSTQTTSNALLATLAVITILSVMNLMAVRYSGQLDLTENQRFTLAPQTKEVLQQLSEPVKVWSFMQPPPVDEQTLLERFKQLNPARFEFEFVDPQTQPGLAQKYQITASNQVVLEQGDRTKTISSPFSEADLTPALASLVSNLKINAYLTEGHGELPPAGGQVNLQSALDALNKRDFTVSPLNLGQRGSIPDDADVIIIAGPKRPFLDPEVALLKDYLAQGGRLLALLDPEIKTGLENLLQEWNLSLDNRIIVDASGSGQLLGLGPAVPIVVQYGTHPITQDFAQGISFFPLAQAITLTGSPKNRQVTELLITQERSWAEADPDNEALEFDPQRDKQGPLAVGVALEQSSQSSPSASQPQNQDREDSAASVPNTRLVVIGDSDFATSGPFNQGINGDVLINSLSWLGDNSLSLSIRPKEKIERRLQLPALRFRMLALVSIALLPLSAFVAASIIWWKRR
ncbi:GldG family protein [Lyngbya confervoides]|uniref:Gldg family protein n=1 Tax=Lyngbya confervoides BDU141951 TaxID=1574623 RepID=A0ABD4T992_9CYAN|nr:Gldg family protein [Lyngbya confervoides]MCM1985367.1 Gldg family protein [Lyngbya confervoides BDU141951]